MPNLSNTYQAKIIYLISIYFVNTIFCLLTFNNFVISPDQFEKIPIKCVFMFFLIYTIPLPFDYNMTRVENFKYKIQIGSIETDTIRIILLKLAYT